jgi:glyoxylase-like metal-dependent hydrolase (beta-lactamase superfamily II)
MREIAPDLFLLSGFPPAAFNVYLIRSGERWVLIDSASRHARRRILRQLPGELEAIVITHAHHDHAGSMHAIATETNAPVWAGERDAQAIEAGDDLVARPNHIFNRAFANWWRDPHPVSRRLREGEPIADFTVIDFPGHTPGHLGLWREADRTIICADTMRSMNIYAGFPQLGELPFFTHIDVRESRRSIRKLAALEANTICFGHGRPLTKNAAARIKQFAKKLPN